MDNKSFNEQELSDIMKEIEALEEDFSGEKQATPVMEELSHMDETQSIPSKVRHHEEEVLEEHHAEIFTMESSHPKVQKPTSAMSFKVSGDLNMELQFDIGGKVVCLEVTEAGLNIQMEGGVTFHVPVGDHKKSA